MSKILRSEIIPLVQQKNSHNLLAVKELLSYVIKLPQFLSAKLKLHVQR